jgi:hypothetical protein
MTKKENQFNEYQPGDKVTVVKSPQYPLPIEQSDLFLKEGTVKLAIHQDDTYIVELEGDLYQIYVANLYPVATKVEVKYKLIMKPDTAEDWEIYRKENGIKNSNKIPTVSFPSVMYTRHPLEKEVAQQLSRHRGCSIAMVQKVYKQTKGAE